jgi:hypothetical protein
MMREQTGKFERPVYSRPEQVVAVPPAGGEVEIAGYAGRNAVKGFMNNGSEVSVMLKPERFFDIPLTPLENITRLQAENAALQHRLTIADQRVDDLESELTKARECIAHTLGLLRADKSTHAQYAILRYQEFPTDNQSAPAANFIACKVDESCGQDAPAAKGGDSIGGECWSCKKPVTLIEWVETDGHCPHCDAEIDEAEGVKP